MIARAVERYARAQTEQRRHLIYLNIRHVVERVLLFGPTALTRWVCGREMPVQAMGIRMTMDLSALSDFAMALRIKLFGGYERGATALVDRCLEPGDTFVDIGANSGYFSLVAAQLVGPEGRVYSIEPGPSQVKRLRRNLDSSGNASTVTVLPYAASNFDGRTLLYESYSMDGRDSLQRKTGSATQVEVHRLDSVLPEAVVAVAKIDVEGEELHALQGMERILNRSKRIRLIIEWNVAYARPELWKFLDERFWVWVIRANSPYIRGAPINDPSTITGVQDLWCIPKRAEEMRPAFPLYAPASAAGLASPDSQADHP